MTTALTAPSGLRSQAEVTAAAAISSAIARARRRADGGMVGRVAAISRSANLWIYARHCFSGLKQLASPARRIVGGGQGRNLEPRRRSCREASRPARADSDARAGRAGQRRTRRAALKAEAKPAPAHFLRGLGNPAADLAVADRHRSAVAGARAAR